MIFGANINLEVFEIFRTDSSSILLFYNEIFLSRVLSSKANSDFLNKFGYSRDMSLKDSLGLLKDRYYYNFCPHEMGIFLGIPLQDVKDFICKDRKECICCGYWKVYNNREYALRIFKNYDKSKHDFMKLIEKNIGIAKAVEMLSSCSRF